MTDPAAHGPIAGAEVTLYAVDKGVLSLTGYQMPNLLRTFYHPRPLDVQTGLTIPDLLSEDPEDMNFSERQGVRRQQGLPRRRRRRARDGATGCGKISWRAPIGTPRS